MLKTILIACGLTLSLALATGAQAKLESWIGDVPPPMARNIVLSFFDPVDPDRSKARVVTSSGREIAIDELRTNGPRTKLSVIISMPLSPGTYHVFCQAVFRKGQVASGVSELTVPSEGISRSSEIIGR